MFIKINIPSSDLKILALFFVSPFMVVQNTVQTLILFLLGMARTFFSGFVMWENFVPSDLDVGTDSTLFQFALLQAERAQQASLEPYYYTLKKIEFDSFFIKKMVICTYNIFQESYSQSPSFIFFLFFSILDIIDVDEGVLM